MVSPPAWPPLARAAALLAVAVLTCAPALADGLRYRVRIDAPRPLDTLLEQNLDLERFRGNARIDREQLQRMVRVAPAQIRTLVATDGYYSPEVSVRLDAEGDEPLVLIRVQPGEPVRVGEVELELQGFEPPPGQPADRRYDRDALLASWGLPRGAVFRQADWEQAKRALLRQVVQTRYPRAQLIDSQAAVDPDTHLALLRVVLDSGPELHFGALRIEGLKRYPPSIVANLNQIQPGDDYSEAALQAFQGRLQDTGYFATVEVSADMSAVIGEQLAAGEATQAQAQPQAQAQGQAPAPMPPLPLLVRVTENKRKNASAGLGYSTNTGNRASLTYDDLSLFGLRMKSALTLETKKQSAHSDFYYPVTAQGYRDSIGASFERSDISGEITSVAAISGKRAWGTPLLERSLTLEFLSETKTIANVETGSSKSLPLTYGATWRHLDSLLFPTKGYVINAQLGGALLPILTDQAFVRGYARAVLYHPLGAHSNMILRAEGGALASREKQGVPAVYLFRAGGDQSVRGYAYQQLGIQEGTAITGGRYMSTGSAEFQYWFKPTWGAAVFYDAGSAADTIKDLHPKSGYGVGGRWKSPVGPINVDLAYGHAVRKYRLHFSLGFTF
ncbi:autotransporter assembly complex protein TamA [Rugamonas apoptosis]|uniref:autotransporter assembly complex protein TamA n=1 Tax=Rugamonas apoptosis TaxID=2758570 RepID=UPI0035CD2F69